MKWLTRKNRIGIMVMLVCLCMVCSMFMAVNHAGASYTNQSSMVTACQVDTKYFYSNCLYEDYPMVLLEDWEVGSENDPGIDILFGMEGMAASAQLKCETAQTDYVTPYFVYEEQKYDSDSEFIIELNDEEVTVPICLEPVESAVKALTEPKKISVDVKCILTISAVEQKELSAELVVTLYPEGMKPATENPPEADTVSGGDNLSGNVSDGDSRSESVSGGDSQSGSVSDGDGKQEFGIVADGNLAKENLLTVSLAYETFDENAEEPLTYEGISLHLYEITEDGKRRRAEFPAFTRYYESDMDYGFIPAYPAAIELERGEKDGIQLLLDFSQAKIEWKEGNWQLEAVAVKSDGTADIVTADLKMVTETVPLPALSTNALEPIVTRTQDLEWLIQAENADFDITIEKLTATGYYPVTDDEYLLMTISEENPDYPGQYTVKVSASDGMARAGTYRLVIRKYFGSVKVIERSFPFFINYR